MGSISSSTPFDPGSGGDSGPHAGPGLMVRPGLGAEMEQTQWNRASADAFWTQLHPQAEDLKANSDVHYVVRD